MIALLWLLFLVPLAAGLWAQKRVTEVFARYRRVENHARVTGAQAAATLLAAHGLDRIRVEMAGGFLSDHYDGQAGALRLSQPVAEERSVSSLGIAAHEVSHAYQDADGSRWYRIRQDIAVPLSRVAPYGGLVFIGGFWLGIPVLMILSLAYVLLLVAFALATLPVELGASHNALALLSRTHLANPEEVGEVRSVLRAAALTYVAGLLRQVGFFAALVAISGTVHGMAG
jgi:Zn-dependent membrane protease YugP